MSADEHPTQPLPDPSATWILQTDASARAPRRHRRWPWLVAVLAVAALAVGAWFAGEYIARGIVERTRGDMTISLRDQRLREAMQSLAARLPDVGELPEVQPPDADDTGV